MATQIISQHEQPNGSFDNGAILEKKPIGFPQDGGLVKPFSSLFYWAYAWSDKGGLIDEHPHQGFEIMTFVLKGAIEHYDSKIKKWIRLESGGCQIIKAGSGISHAEKLLPGSAIFQIWFDPDLSESIHRPPQYNDYPIEELPAMIEQGKQSLIFVGEESPVITDTDGLHICSCMFSYKVHRVTCDKDNILCGFLIVGEMEMNGKKLSQGDFFIVSDEDIIAKSIEDSKVFMIQLPKNPGYKTYAESI